MAANVCASSQSPTSAFAFQKTGDRPRQGERQKVIVVIALVVPARMAQTAQTARAWRRLGDHKGRFLTTYPPSMEAHVVAVWHYPAERVASSFLVLPPPPPLLFRPLVHAALAGSGRFRSESLRHNGFRSESRRHNGNGATARRRDVTRSAYTQHQQPQPQPQQS
jgi:hypothetical protein